VAITGGKDCVLLVHRKELVERHIAEGQVIGPLYPLAVPNAAALGCFLTTRTRSIVGPLTKRTLVWLKVWTRRPVANSELRCNARWARSRPVLLPGVRQPSVDRKPTDEQHPVDALAFGSSSVARDQLTNEIPIDRRLWRTARHYWPVRPEKLVAQIHSLGASWAEFSCARRSLTVRMTLMQQSASTR
jgi:hypothetical protein